MREHWPIAVFAAIAGSIIVGVSVTQGESWRTGLLIALFPVWGAIGLATMIVVVYALYFVAMICVSMFFPKKRPIKERGQEDK